MWRWIRTVGTVMVALTATGILAQPGVIRDKRNPEASKRTARTDRIKDTVKKMTDMLKLSAAQQKKITSMLIEHENKLKKLAANKKLTTAQIKATNAKERDKTTARVRTVLTKAQAKRYDEINAALKARAAKLYAANKPGTGKVINGSGPMMDGMKGKNQTPSKPPVKPTTKPPAKPTTKPKSKP